VRGELHNRDPRPEGEHRTPEERASVERLQTPEGLREEQLRVHQPLAAQRERALDLGGEWEPTSTGLLVPPHQKRRFEKPIAIDLFAGCGGMSCGLHKAGFHVIAALELEPHAAITYAVNLGQYGLTQWHFETDEIRAKVERAVDPKGRMQKALDEGTVTPQMCADFPMVGSGWISKRRAHEPGTCAHHLDDDESTLWFCDTYCKGGRDFDAEPVEHMWLWDAREITGADLLDAIDAEVGDVDLVAGGPPCQGFSHSGKRQVADPRNNLVFEFARLICEIRPKAMIMENVPGIASMRMEDGRSVVDEFCAILEAGDYAAHEATRRALLARTDVGHARRGKSAHKSSGETMPGRVRRVVRGADDPDEAEQLALEAV
jgi:DNA (cytosine-5)-methyltransferase 1